jgi:osmotically-inducible protein OsmY
VNGPRRGVDHAIRIILRLTSGGKIVVRHRALDAYTGAPIAIKRAIRGVRWGVDEATVDRRIEALSSNTRGREAAERRIAMTEATRSYEQSLSASGEIATVAAHLAQHLRGRLRDASVTIHRGGVVIRGTTKSYYVKQLAQHAVMKHVSLPIVANEIDVQA